MSWKLSGKCHDIACSPSDTRAVRVVTRQNVVIVNAPLPPPVLPARAAASPSPSAGARGVRGPHPRSRSRAASSRGAVCSATWDAGPCQGLQLLEEELLVPVSLLQGGPDGGHVLRLSVGKVGRHTHARGMRTHTYKYILTFKTSQTHTHA